MTSADNVCLLCMRETPLPHQYPCPFCGGDDRTLPLQSPALPPHTVLDRRYVVGKTLGQGGFGITYQAYDLRMGNTVAVKEYFPSSLVGRDSTVSSAVTVNAIKGTKAMEEYASGLRHFLHEARRQARLASSPGVVSVSDFFEYNNTAYYIMEYVDGCTLVKYIQKPQPMEAVLHLLEPIADSLRSIHEAGLIHRDISPDNIMCAKNGQRKLLDFGASHSFTEEESTTGNATLKHGFAPPEQYGSSSMQGPWTDVYAFAATVYWCLTGKIPQDSMDRSIGGDRLRPPSELGAVISQEAESILMRGMALPVTARYQSMTVFWNKLKNASNNVRERLNVQPRPEFTDPDGKTTVVTMIEVPERTKVPEPIMEGSLPVSSKVEKPLHSVPPVEPPAVTKEPVLMEEPEHTKVPEPVMEYPAAEKPAFEPEEPEPSQEPSAVQDPDITLYRPNMAESDPMEKPKPTKDPVPVEEEPEPRQPVKDIVRTDNRLLAALVGVIALLLMVIFCVTVLPRITQNNPSQGSEDLVVTIGDTTYPLTTTELYLTGSPDYTSRYRKELEFTQVSYLSKSDWSALCQLTNLKKLSVVGCQLESISGLEALSELEVLDLSDNEISDVSALSEMDGLMELYLADNELDTVEQLAPLTSLVYLDVSGNQISDLSTLSGMTRLSTLYLQENQISDLSPLSAMTDLATLDVANNHLDSLKELYSLQKLRMLYVDGNSLPNQHLVSLQEKLPDCTLDVDVLTDIPETVTIGGKSYSTSLTELDLHSSGLKDGDIDDLRYMVNLTKLELSGNELSDLSSISRLYGLTNLSVSHNQISDLSFLKNLIHLDTLYLSSNRITDLSQLSQLTELQELAIGNNQFTDLTPVANLTKMTLLVMCDCKADSLEPLYAMKDLFELRVSRNTYSQEELAALKTAIPGCTINQY